MPAATPPAKAKTTARCRGAPSAGLRQEQQLARCVDDADIEATASEGFGASARRVRRFSFFPRRKKKREHETRKCPCFFSRRAFFKKKLDARRSHQNFRKDFFFWVRREQSTISTFPHSFPLPSTPFSSPTMRSLLALALCILSMALGQVVAREMAGLRLLSASNADAAAASATSKLLRSGATSASLPEITLYGEALCPDTAAFVSRTLGPLLDAGAIAKSGGKGGSGAGTSKSSSRAAATPSAPASASASTSASSLPSSLASEPGGGFLSAHSGGPAPTALTTASEPLTLGKGGAAGTVTINSAPSSSAAAPDSSENAPAASFRMVAWGHARRSADGTKVTCQHGPRECELNKLLECSQAKQKGTEAFFPATLRCFFATLGKAGGGTPASLEKCVGDDALWAQISACAAGPEGTTLEAAAGTETLDTQSGLTFVPWVVVDGKQLAGECGSALKAACESAKAKGVSPLAPACSRLPELTSKGCPGAV